jgi:subtilisin family serine protease
MRPVIEGDVPSFGRPARPREYVPGQVVVRVRPEAVRPHVAAPRMALSQSVADSLPDSIGEPVDYLRRNAGLKAVDPLFSPRLAQLRRSRLPPAARYRLAVAASVADVETDDLAGLAVASLPERRITGDLLETIGSSPGVEFAERLPTRWLEADGPDPKQNLQWGLRAIRYFDARRPSAADVRVAILDTGIDTTHPDLPDPVLYRHQGLRAQDIIGHGSHVAGIIAAIANNRIGITGIADCRLAVWKIFPDQPERGDFYVDSERYLRALGELPDEEVAAVNLSIGGAAHSQAEALLFRRLIERGVTPVAAMGNEYEEGNPTSYPAAYDDVVSVGAIAETRRRSRFSSTGRHIDLVAPGSNILSTVPMRRSAYRQETEYVSWSGTSMATPHVTAAVALLAAAHPGWSSAQISHRLRGSAEQLPAMRGSRWTQTYGAGLLDLRTALS